MANKNLFNTKVAANTSCNSLVTNNAGGKAYSRSAKAALAQYAMTGCFNNTYYATNNDQLKSVIDFTSQVEDEFIAKLAVYARQQGLMKDMPAVLAAILANRNVNLLSKVFDQVIDSPKMLRNFVQILRSGVTGRKSLGTRPKKLIQNYLNSLTDEQLFKADIGNNPSLTDIIKMVHPKPMNNSRSALYSYFLNKNYDLNDLNPIIKDFENFKKNSTGHIPNVPFQMLTSLPLLPEHWKQIASHASWQQTRMNLNSFARHGVFEDAAICEKIAKKLSDKENVKMANAFPYQLYAAFKSANGVPTNITNSLQYAAEHALDNVPSFKGKVYIMVDVSGSMSSPVTGYRGVATTRISCLDVAAIFASAILRKNSEAEIIPFDTQVHTRTQINPQDSIMTNAEKLSKFGGGGTNCSEALAYVNGFKGMGDLVVYISDNESWCDSQHYNSTATMEEWDKFKLINPNAKLVNIDIQPSKTSQVLDRKDILNIGGFNDNIFNVISKFLEYGNDDNLWINSIESIIL
jgi:60 kDa SS-A/Ro ribonucleoprotein